MPRIAYEALLGASADEALASALTSEGVVALTGVPGLAAARDAALRGAHECARKEGASGASATFADGTDRATVAAEVAGIDGFGPLTLFDGATTADKCADVAGFGPAAAMLRASVAAAAGTFTERLAATFAPADDQPLLVDSEDEAVSYEGFMDVVAHGAHLEHFHSYHAKADSANDTIGDTIELHTDAGLMIAFVPAVMFDATKSELSGGAAAGSFLVELADGSRAVADFGGADTAGTLVFMIGDGAEAYYNPRAAEGKTLRACPHAMAMPDNKGGSANPDNFRLWYGRMFLPPPTALSTAHGASFGAVRSGMIADVATGKGVSAGVGCARALLQTDATPECADNQMFCWMRCMDFTETVSPEACAEQDGLRVQCASQRDQIWRHEDSHGDYRPTCTNSTQHVTPTPTIPTRNATFTGNATSEDEHDGHDHGSHDHGDDGDDESCDGHGWVMGEGAAAHCMCEDGYGYPSVDEPLVCAQGGEYGMDDLGGHDGDHGDHDHDGNSNESTSAAAGSATPAAASIAAFAALCVALNLDN